MSAGQVYAEQFAMLPEDLLDAEVSDRAVRLWAMLHRYSGKDGRAFPGRRTLSRRLRCSTSTLDTTLRELEAAGWLRIEGRRRDDGGQTSNDYHLTRPDPLPADSDPPTDGLVGGSQPVGTLERESGKESQRTPSPRRGAGAKGPREPNHAWDALVEVIGWDPKTRHEKARVGKAVREITAALPDGTSREDVAKHIRARAGRYREHWPTAELTPESLVKHWSKFSPAAVQLLAHPTVAAPAPERGTLTRSELLGRRDPADLTYEEFLESLQVLSEGEQMARREARRTGLAWKVRTEHGEAPTAETGWLYQEEQGWIRRAAAAH